MSAEAYNQRIRHVWEQFSANGFEGTRREPLILHKVSRNAILFVGMNPSFVPKVLKKDLNLPDEQAVEDLFRFRPGSKRTDIPAASPKNSTYRRYFDIYAKISEDVGKDWDHVDLFYLRETNQKRVLSYVGSESGLTPFGESQFQITEDVIKEAKPAAIVVCNARASAIFRKRMLPSSSELHKNVGCYLMNFERRTPVFLSGMLTGQRALDVESRKRLVWHLDFALRQL